MVKIYKNLTPQQKAALKEKQDNINKAINHFLAHKQYPIIVNKILDNYGKKKSLTFGLFKKILKYAFKHPKHAYFLMKLLQSRNITDKLEAYLQTNYNHMALNTQILNLINNQKLIDLLCKEYSDTLNSYNLSKENISSFIAEIASEDTKDVLPVLLKNARTLLEINKYFNNNQLVDATKETLKLLEKEPNIKKYTKFLVLKTKNWLLRTKSIINNNPLTKEILQLPNKPLAALIGVVLNSINKDLFDEAIEIYNKQDYNKLVLFILNLIKSEHAKKSSELIGFLSCKQNKELINQIISILLNYQPNLTNIIPNIEDVAKLISNKAGIERLIHLSKTFQEDTKVGIAKGIIKTSATTPIIPSIITKSALGWMMGKLSNWWSPNNKPSKKSKL